MIVGIIGGTGKMGRFFKSVFESIGHTTLISGQSTILKNRGIATQADLVVVAVPIHATVPVIAEIAPLLSEHQVICDLTSLKVKPVEAMLRSKAQVIGLHPMFGPSVASLAGQTIIATPARTDGKAIDTILSIFKDQGARIVIMTPDEHDSMMAIIQGLTHFSTLCMAEAMRLLNTDIARALDCTSPIYRIDIDLIGRLLNQDPALYGDILQMNPYVPQVIAAFQDAVTRLSAITESKSLEQFIDFFNENAGRFHLYSEGACQETDALIEFMVHR